MTGNEADNVILSIVRTTSPGFLVSQNRSNVMLTRCKAGLVIVTNRIFLRTTGAQHTLLGELVRHWSERHGTTKTWRDWKEIAEHKADMPGAPAPRRSNTSIIINTNTPVTAPRQSLSQVIPATVLPPASSAHKENSIASIVNEFPSLVTGGSIKSTTESPWLNPVGVSAIKRVGISYHLASAGVQPPLATQTKQKYVKPTTCSEDHFPMLGNVRVEKVKNWQRTSSNVAK